MNLLDLFVVLGVKDEASEEVESLSGKIKTGIFNAGKVAATGLGLVTTATGTVVGGLLALESSTEEYRVAQGKLNTAFESAGYSTETATQAYEAFYGILGDTDTATEASQLLAKLADSEEDVATWTNIAAGVSGTFGDSLPIEGLIEASNETAKVGQVTGALADALNWAGISEDDFNAALAECTDESERNQLIMDTLSGTYDEASDAFYRNNEALVESRNNQAQLDAAMAALGGTVSEVKNRVLSEFIPALGEVATAFSGMLQGTEGANEQFSEAVSGLVATAVEKLPEFLNFGVNLVSTLAQGILQNIPTVVAAIPQVVASIGTALTSLAPQVLQMGMNLLSQLASGIETELPNFVARLPQIITNFVDFISNNLPTILDQGVQILNSVINGIINSIPSLVAALPQVISAIVSFVAQNLPTILKSGVDILQNLITGIINTIPELVSNLPQIVGAIVNGIGALMGSIVNIGVDIVRGIWQGIQNMASWLWNQVSGFFSNIVNGVKSALGIASPSKVFASIGGYMAEGVGQGWDDEFSSVRKNIEAGLDFGTGAASISATYSSAGASAAQMLGQSGGGSFVFEAGAIVVNTRATDAKAIAKDLYPAIKTMLQNEVTRKRVAHGAA